MTLERPLMRTVPVPADHRAAGSVTAAGGRNRALDGLRGLAVSAVVLRHLNVRGFGGGGTGVFLFFVLSGFLITELLCAELAGTGRISLRAFWGRRAARLLPAFAAAVALAVVVAALVGAGPAHVAKQSLPAVLYGANWWRVHELASPGGLTLGPFEHTWSLSVEEQFYLLWPLLLLAMLLALRRRLGIVVGLTALAALGSVLDRAALWNAARPLLSAAILYNRTDTEAVLLLTGATAALILRLRRVEPASPFLPAAGLVGLAVVVALAAGQPLTASPHLELWWTAGVAAFAVGGAVLCYAVVRAPGSALARALAWRPVSGLGRISYAVYLYHYPLVVLLAPRVGGAAGDVLVVGLTLLLAILSWYALERPILRAHRRRVAAAPPAAARPAAAPATAPRRAEM